MTLKLTPLLAGALLVGLAACDEHEKAPAPEGTFTEGECPYQLPGEDMLCGTLDVPEDYDEPEGRRVRLPVAILPASAPAPAADPIVYLNGGPGQSAVSWLLVISRIGAPRANRDLIVIEQRGNGAGEPALLCDADEAVRACHDRLVAEGIDLARYGNADSARDVEALRGALGYEAWNLYGISYGTTLAMHVLAMFPTACAAWCSTRQPRPTPTSPWPTSPASSTASRASSQPARSTTPAPPAFPTRGRRSWMRSSAWTPSPDLSRPSRCKCSSGPNSPARALSVLRPRRFRTEP